MQRAAEIAAAAPRDWKRERGDLTIPWDEAKGHLAIVIDDTGRELHVFEQLLSLRFPLTFAVLPDAVFSAGVQVRLQADRRRYREVLLHLPMEPMDPAEMETEQELRETFLRVGDTSDGLRTKTVAALAAVPQAIGVNNHMGSRLTTDREAMDVVMKALAGRELLFLDSRTTADTVARSAAAAAGLVTGSRDVFLDHEPGIEAISAALQDAARRAQTEPIVAIAHPTTEVVTVLRDGLPRLRAQGVGIYPLSRILLAANTAEDRGALQGSDAP